MSKPIIFIQVQGRPGILEAEVPESATLGELQEAIAAAGAKVDAETFIFVDESEQHEQGEGSQRMERLKHGSRVHLSHCRRIKTTVHYLDKTAERDFPPGARLRVVKDFAVRTFNLNPQDAAEHVLQICNSTKRPSSDTPLHELVEGQGCALCFDLVPEKRVEG